MEGFEPPKAEPESAVLPLHYIPINLTLITLQNQRKTVDTLRHFFVKNNASFINNGVCVTKFTGARGKSGTSDASAEYVSWVKTLLEDNGVLWQSGELGKVDGGGGGTVAMFIANKTLGKEENS